MQYKKAESAVPQMNTKLLKTINARMYVSKGMQGTKDNKAIPSIFVKYAQNAK
jgi:hypothetical protein